MSYERHSDKETISGAVVFTHSDPMMPIVHVVDGVVADYARGPDRHHTEETESLSRVVLAAVQAWEAKLTGGVR